MTSKGCSSTISSLSCQELSDTLPKTYQRDLPSTNLLSEGRDAGPKTLGDPVKPSKYGNA